MSFPACPSCGFPDVPVADRAIEVATASASGTPCVSTTTVHRGYRCAGCLKTFWTAETVAAVGTKTAHVRPLYYKRL
jgi:hypothetical protein